MTTDNRLQEILWPRIRSIENIDGAQWVISTLSHNRDSACRVAEMCSQEAPFLHGRCVLNWLTDSAMVEKKFEDPDFGFFGVWCNDELVGVVIFKAHQVDLVLELAFCCVDKSYKNIKCSEMISLFAVSLLKNTRAHVVYADCVTHFLGAQNAVESAGFRPIGVQLAMEVFGGKDGSLSRATTVRYAFYADEVKCNLPQPNELRLTHRSFKLFEAVKSALEHDDDNVVHIPFNKAG